MKNVAFEYVSCCCCEISEEFWLNKASILGLVRTGIMPLTLHKATFTDLPTIISIQFAAFQQSSPIERLVYPLGLTPAILTSALVSRERSFHDSQTYHLKIVNSDLVSESGQMQPAERDEEQSVGSSSEVTASKSNTIAFARYYMWHEQREAAVWDSPYSVREGELGPPGEVNLDAARLFFGQVRELTRRFVRGRKCVCKLIRYISHIYVMSSFFAHVFFNNVKHQHRTSYDYQHVSSPITLTISLLTPHIHRPDLSLLATRPSHQHLGAGTMLVQWGIDLADREDLELFLTATPTGHSLYRKMGFEDIAAFEIDLGTLGGTAKNDTGGFYKHVLMRRGIGEGKGGEPA